MNTTTAVNIQIEYHPDGCRLAYVETEYVEGILSVDLKLPLDSSIAESLIDLANRMAEHGVPGWEDSLFQTAPDLAHIGLDLDADRTVKAEALCVYALHNKRQLERARAAMPALVPVPGVCRVVYKSAYDNQPVANVMHVHNGTGIPYSQAQVDLIATGMRTAFATYFLPLVNSKFILATAEVTDLSNDTGVVGIASGSTPGSAGSSSTALPANICLCVSWKTTAHYRGGHGRTYFAGMGLTDQLNMTSWTTAVQTAWLAAANNFRTAITTIGVTPTLFLVIVSRWKDKTTRVTPLARNVVAASIDSRIDTQRRRLGRDRQVVAYYRTTATGEAIFTINDYGGISHISATAGEVFEQLFPGWYSGRVLDLSAGASQWHEYILQLSSSSG